MPWYSRYTLHNATAPLAPELESVVEYLHNSKDIYVIHLLNEIPVRVRRRDIPSVIKTLEGLISRLNGEKTDDSESSENSEATENIERSENSECSDATTIQ